MAGRVGSSNAVKVALAPPTVVRRERRAVVAVAVASRPPLRAAVEDPQPAYAGRVARKTGVAVARPCVLGRAALLVSGGGRAARAGRRGVGAVPSRLVVRLVGARPPVVRQARRVGVVFSILFV